MTKKQLSKKKLNTIEKYLEDKSKDYKLLKEKFNLEYHEKDIWTTTTDKKGKKIDLPNPFSVVVEFIKEKGLKLYGGQALHEHLKKFKAGFYKKYSPAFPDYDVFLLNSWEHAKELANRLYDMGFHFSEAKGSILNDEGHQTYKVSVDMVYILDLTQSGCTPKEMIKKDCKNCGKDKSNKCFSLFNNVPCNNLINYTPKKSKAKTFTETYDFKKDKGIYPNKLFVCDPNWLKISMYRELTEPLSNPDRLPKVGKRLEIFKHYFEFDHTICKGEAFIKEILSRQSN